MVLIQRPGRHVILFLDLYYGHCRHPFFEVLAEIGIRFLIYIEIPNKIHLIFVNIFNDISKFAIMTEIRLI